MKETRQLEILDLVTKQDIETQEELVDGLRNRGCAVTQATVSRDIKELRLIKAPNGMGGYKYAPATGAKQETEDRLHKLFASTVLSVSSANNIVVLKTMQGSANTVAVVVDSLDNADILGCVAGDDTVIIVVSSNDTVKNVTAIIQELIK